MPARHAWLIPALLLVLPAHAGGLSPTQRCEGVTAAVRAAYQQGTIATPPAVARLLVEAIDGHQDAVLLQLGQLPPQDRPRWRQVAMLAAVVASHASEVAALLDAGASIDAPALLPDFRKGFVRDTLSPSLYAAAKRNRLLGHPASYGPALLAAVECGNAAMVDLLLARGADATATSAPGAPDALMMATVQGNAYVVSRLLDHGATACGFDRRPHHGKAPHSLADLGRRSGLSAELVQRLRCAAK